MDKWLNTTTAYPLVNEFATTGGQGTPLCVDQTTAFGYVLLNNVITPLANATLDIPTRAALAALTFSLHPIFLTEPGREGWWRFDSTNISASCSGGFAFSDTQQGLYVLPVSDLTGASGYWKRIFSGFICFSWFGAVGDSTGPGAGTVNDAALAGAQATISAGILYSKKGRYRFSTQPVIKTGISLLGEGWTENPGIAGGVTYSGVFAYDGTMWVFDTSTPGPIAYDITDTGDASTVNADIIAHGLASVYWKFKTARHCFARDMLFYGGGGAIAHGFESRTQYNFEGIACINFGGSGLKIIASADSGPLPYGSADGSHVSNCRFDQNGMHGIHSEGRDANVIKFTRNRCANNGGLGIYELGFLGNVHDDFDCATNNRSYGTSSAQRTQLLIDCPALASQYFGSIYATSAVATHKFHGYIEGGTGSIGFAALGHITGQCADESLWTSDTTALVETTAGVIIRGHKKHINRLGSKVVGINFGLNTTTNDILAFGNVDDDGGSGNYQNWRLGDYNADGGGSWHLYYVGSLAASAFQLPTTVSTWNIRGAGSTYAFAFPNGYFLGGNGFGGVIYVGKSTIMPTTGTWTQGDFITNATPTVLGAAGSQYTISGWRRITTGTNNVLNTDWVEARNLTGT